MTDLIKNNFQDTGRYYLLKKSFVINQKPLNFINLNSDVFYLNNSYGYISLINAYNVNLKSFINHIKIKKIINTSCDIEEKF